MALTSNSTFANLPSAFSNLSSIAQLHDNPEANYHTPSAAHPTIAANNTFPANRPNSRRNSLLLFNEPRANFGVERSETLGRPNITPFAAV